MRTLALFLFAATAMAQVPSVSVSVTLTIAPPPNSRGYAYIISRAPAAGGSCPAPSMTSPVYVPLNQKAPSAALIYVDTPAVNGSVCYSVQSIVNGIPSTPAAPAGPFGISAPTVVSFRVDPNVSWPLDTQWVLGQGDGQRFLGSMKTGVILRCDEKMGRCVYLGNAITGDLSAPLLVAAKQ